MNRLEGRFAARQIPGGREYQEDDYGLIESGASDRDEVLVIADGMGGQVSGDTASHTVIKTFIETYSDTTGLISDRLRACLEAANDALASAIDAHPALAGMGTTVVAAVISQRGLEWISVGDSPLWLFREGQLRRLNADHSMAAVFADLVAVGRMTEEEAATDPKRHALRSAVMGDEIHLIDVSSQPVALKRGDRVILASDGLLTLADGEIARILQTMQDAPLSEIAEALIQAVEDAAHPHQDNTTVLLYTPDADKGVDAVIADPREGKSRGHQLKIGLVASGVALLALLYWFWPTPSTPPALTEAMPSKNALPEAPAQLDTGKVSGELAQKAEDEAEETKAEETKVGESGSDESSSGETKTGESDSGKSKTGDSDSDGSGFGESKAGESKTGESKAGESDSGGSGSGGGSGGSKADESGSGDSGGAGAGGAGSDGSGETKSGGSGSTGTGSTGSKSGGKAGETKSEKPPTRRKRGNI